MGEPRADKVAVVTEVKEKFEASSGVLLTEYRGIDVPGMAELRKSLVPAGGEYKIYKNTLVKLAAGELGIDLDELLVGPTALAFVVDKADGTAGDAAAVAKALRDYAKSNEALVIKGGLLDGKSLSPEEIRALAELPSRDVLFAEFAGAMEYMLGDFAGLLENKLREFVYAMEELVEKRGSEEVAVDESGEAAVAEPEPEQPEQDKTEEQPDQDKTEEEES